MDSDSSDLGKMARQQDHLRDFVRCCSGLDDESQVIVTQELERMETWRKA
jgi:hypothetical protein